MKKPYFIVIFGILCCTFIFSQKSAAIRELNAWKLLPRPERLTELYFADTALAARQPLVDQPQSLAFTIHNIEFQTVTYYYRVTIDNRLDDKAEEILDNGTLTLGHDHLRTTTCIVSIPRSAGHLILRVHLRYKSLAFGKDTPEWQSQSINYRVKAEKISMETRR